MDYAALINRLSRRGLFRIKPGLDRVRQVLADLGHPQDAVPSIHIAGTNGKGSVAASLESVLRHAGLRTGLYTSPHLRDVRERIQIDRQPISLSAFRTTAQALFNAERRTGITLTYFEFLTVMAFLTFERQAVDVAIVETGMGGRWDATNVLAHPALTVITSIGFDHVQWLGKSETAIAREKAGIIKPGSPLVSGARGHAAGVITTTARREGAFLRQIDRDFQVHVDTISWVRGSQQVRYRTRSQEQIVSSNLLGRHQADNIALVVAGLDVLKEKWNIPAQAIQDGLSVINWPSPFQLWPSAAQP